ncbi:MAG TPA: hypothetical protein PLX88_02750 [Syntrophorhabdaceae bacterium]|jgi:hypothetical protein|nr:hypothetical protein [Syntrophorhabdaceae bacterium]MDI9561353.1 hypothetical protein [Pseudomonadota bacterium]OQC47266.1 MAG: hypothetical protein BWX58_01624 [Deltaproteobacteria bacterium ADurb.Bin026]MBP8697539.1 hypothetical protein [Syntrophorhabdaceae bacterium]MBV6505923.1 hypothetical protein [Syntrophorhabdaceae bacterium]
MITLEMNKEEAELLLNVMERYQSHLEVEIVKTKKREFKESLKERERGLKTIIERLSNLLTGF